MNQGEPSFIQDGSVEFSVGPLQPPSSRLDNPQEPHVDHQEKEKYLVLLSLNAIFGGLFLVALALTIVLKARREINDLFLRYALYCLMVALALSSLMCFIVASYHAERYMNDSQTVTQQQVYFEVPFYMFLIVIASVLFSWQEAYQMYYL